MCNSKQLKDKNSVAAVRSPLRWVGGKFYLAKKIVKLLPEHYRYIEVFGGAMHLLFRKEPSRMEVYNDIDGNLVNFFNVVKNKPDELLKQLDYTLYSREIFSGAKLNMDSGSDVERAHNFYIVNCQCFGGKMKTWGISPSTINSFFRYEQRIREAHSRLKTVYIEHMDFRAIIKKYDAPDALFFCDPPYIFNENRSSTRAYNNEMTSKDHAELVELLKTIKSKFILCGYENSLYSAFKRVYIGDSNICVKHVCDEKRSRKSEYIWKNF